MLLAVESSFATRDRLDTSSAIRDSFSTRPRRAARKMRCAGAIAN